MPYQVLGMSCGAAAVTIAWIRSAITRSDSGISLTLASRSASPAARSLLARAAALSSLARSFIAACSAAVNPLAGLAGFVVSFMGVLVMERVEMVPMLGTRRPIGFSEPAPLRCRRDPSAGAPPWHVDEFTPIRPQSPPIDAQIPGVGEAGPLS